MPLPSSRHYLNFLRRFSVPRIEMLLVLSMVALTLGINILFYNQIVHTELNLRQVVNSDIKTLEAKILSIDSRVQSVSPVKLELKPIEYGVPVKVTRVIDGDTIEIESGERLRYIGIDTPEKNDPRKPVQCFAEEASKRNMELVEGKIIKFYKDVAERDKYGRLLGYVYLEDGTFVNLELVKDGVAFSYPYPPDISKQDEFSQAEKEARESKVGLWSACSVTPSTKGREETNSIGNNNLNE